MMYDEYKGEGVSSKPSLISKFRKWKYEKKIALARKWNPEPYKWFRVSYTFTITPDMQPGLYTFSAMVRHDGNSNYYDNLQLERTNQNDWSSASRYTDIARQTKTIKVNTHE